MWLLAADHPRGCGEKTPVKRLDFSDRGSSPRVRGKGSTPAASPPRRGIIPAGAGKRTKNLSCIFPERDHPRGCGEKMSGNVGVAFKQWIIPAGAGKRDGDSRWLPPRPDHPRGCGEKSKPSPITKAWRGSSPRVRGKVLCVADGGKIIRIIPAGAGKRKHTDTPLPRHRDHPRGCGEKVGSRFCAAGFCGSSPRVRGKVVGSWDDATGNRIIPAGAGKRSRRRRGWWRPSDHPRGCGEKDSAAALCLARRGSSPRVRGKGCLGRARFCGRGIIPAGAGKRCRVQGLFPL